MNIAVVGTGYVGLVSGTCFAHAGNRVTCVDIDGEKVEKLSSGELTIFEPGLEEIFESNSKDGRLTFTSNLEEAIEDAVVICLCLPTPPGEDGSADLKYILDVADDLGKSITDYKVILNKSTVPVGTAEKVAERVSKYAKVKFDVVSNPEFLREGFAVNDFLKPDRIVVGTSSTKAQKLLDKLYAPFLPEGNPVLFMDERSAEMTKYAANSYLAARITFMNEIATLCESLGADVNMVRKGMGSDNRIGHRFLYPGIGFGGSCFPKDVKALNKTAKDNGYEFKILQAVIERNEFQRTRFIDKIINQFNGDIKGKNIAIWGLAFKPNTDDIREAPAIYVIKELLAKGAIITAYDPEAMNNVKGVLGDSIEYSSSAYQALIEADALCICTEWKSFLSPDFEKMKALMKEHVIIDGRNVYELEEMEQKGFTYLSIGRKNINI